MAGFADASHSGRGGKRGLGGRALIVLAAAGLLTFDTAALAAHNRAADNMALDNVAPDNVTEARRLNSIASQAGPGAAAGAIAKGALGAAAGGNLGGSDLGGDAKLAPGYPTLEQHAALVEWAERMDLPRPTPVGYDAASAMIEQLATRAMAILGDGTLDVAERRRLFRELLLSNFDMVAMGRIVLGRNWRRATPEQQTEYMTLFEDYLVATYTRRFQGYSGERLRIKGSRDAREGVTVVRSEIAMAQGDPVRVDWLVTVKSGRPRIIDVVVAGVSMAITHRSDFAAVINRAGGIEGLLAELRAKINS